jgi:signal peptidase I
MSGSDARKGLEKPAPSGNGSGDVPPADQTIADGTLGAVNDAGPGGSDGATAGESAAGGDKPDGGDWEPPQDGEKPQQSPRPRKSAKGPLSFMFELVVLVVVALLLALGIKTWAFQAFFIPSGSMQNTLSIGDRILINKIVYHTRSIARGDIVVFNGEGSWDPEPANSPGFFTRLANNIEDIFGVDHGDDYVKRVIGVPGDHVVCCNAKGQITVNGAALSESTYLYPGNTPSTTRFNITVPAGRLWVMGDHRAISYDSRGHMGDPGGGTIPESAVLGRAFVIIWPVSHWTILNIPATFSQPGLSKSAAASGTPVSGTSGNANAMLESALANGTPIQSESLMPLGLGFAGAVPLTAAQAVVRRRLLAKRRRARKQSR